MLILFPAVQCMRTFGCACGPQIVMQRMSLLHKKLILNVLPSVD